MAINNNNSESGSMPAGFEPEGHRFHVSRCVAMRYGQQCLRQPGHKGRHMAPGGAMVFWEQDSASDQEQQLELGVSALLWVKWARELGVDAADMQVKLLAACATSNVHPSILLLNLY